MHQEYPIHYRGERAGTALVEKQGLYYRIRCQCSAKQEHRRIKVTAGEYSADLGLCVPEGDTMYLQTRLPVKHLGDNEPVFQMWDKNVEECFIAVDPDQPFAYLGCLAGARFAKDGKLVGLILKGLSQDRPDNDQSP